MLDADAIEAINFEQLATATDRLLLRGGAASKRRPTSSSKRRPLSPSLPRAARTSSAHDSSLSSIPRLTAADLADDAQYEPTVVVPPATQAQVFAFTIVIPTLVGIAVGFAALL
jgi:hypothetical protein